mmetsp:Transcript_28789/g.97033  ORF Transcript_28789/g.97033 Transcript_28789/m.97033 type:complete len:433 (+) Transcript_28789:1839-3137(+)
MSVDVALPRLGPGAVENRGAAAEPLPRRARRACGAARLQVPRVVAVVALCVPIVGQHTPVNGEHARRGLGLKRREQRGARLALGLGRFRAGDAAEGVVFGVAGEGEELVDKVQFDVMLVPQHARGVQRLPRQVAHLQVQVADPRLERLCDAPLQLRVAVEDRVQGAAQHRQPELALDDGKVRRAHGQHRPRHDGGARVSLVRQAEELQDQNVPRPQLALRRAQRKHRLVHFELDVMHAAAVLDCARGRGEVSEAAAGVRMVLAPPHRLPRKAVLHRQQEDVVAARQLVLDRTDHVQPELDGPRDQVPIRLVPPPRDAVRSLQKPVALANGRALRPHRRKERRLGARELLPQRALARPAQARLGDARLRRLLLGRLPEAHKSLPRVRLAPGQVQLAAGVGLRLAAQSGEAALLDLGAPLRYVGEGDLGDAHAL